MPTEALNRLEYLCKTIPPLLRKIDEKDFAFKPRPEKWSKKEILGHLIDSATNNHQRFIRSQFQDVPLIIYDQDNWNKFNNYNDLDSNHIIAFWEIYNRHLIHVIRSTPAENLKKECQTEGLHDLLWLFNDYVKHQEHHLRQIVNYG